MAELKAWAKQKLVAVLWWAFKKLDTWLCYLDPPSNEPTRLALAAQRLARQWEDNLGPGYGEAKRHQVFAALVDQFPEIPKRDLSAAIEAAVQMVAP